MRNRLLILALITVSVFSTSVVFAEGFDESKGLGLFSFSRTRNSDVVTIWARVREVKN